MTRVISVVVPTFNGERYLERLLTAVEAQRIDAEVEVIVVDSGSSDGTLGILARHPSVHLITIPNTEFSHGSTRQLAARESRGVLIAYLSQDAVPMSENWLAELAAPFGISSRVALVTGRQYPRPAAFPLQKYEIIGSFDALGPRWGITLAGSVDGVPLDPDPETDGFHSDVNAMVRRDLVLGALAFRAVDYSEDMAMAQDVLHAGLLKAYAGRAVVEHSNDLTRAEYGGRIFDEVLGMRRNGLAPIPLSWWGALRRVVRGSLGDGVRIARDSDYAPIRKLYWWAVNPGYHLRKWRSFRQASAVSLADHASILATSLEGQRRSSV